jgi:hypothetical protein
MTWQMKNHKLKTIKGFKRALKIYKEKLDNDAPEIKELQNIID